MPLPLTTDLVGLLDCPIVDLQVGKKRKKFSVHQKLICNRSTFFDKAFNGPFKEGTDGAVYLPEDSPAVVEVFIAWLYSGVLNPPPPKSSVLNPPPPKSSVLNPPMPKSSDCAESRDSDDSSGFAVSNDVVDNDSTKKDRHKENSSSEDSCNSDDSSDSDNETDSDSVEGPHYMALYFFAEEYGIESLQNQAIDKLTKVTSRFGYSSSEIQSIYDNTTKSSPFRKLMIRQVAYYDILMHPMPDMDEIAKYCELGGEFVKDLMIQLCGAGTKAVKAPKSRPSCAYHVHSDGKRCVRDKHAVRK